MKDTRELSKNIELEKINCDFCGGEDYYTWSRARGNILTKCRQCGLIWTNPRIKHYYIKDTEMYALDYFIHRVRFSRKQVKAREKVYLRERKKIEEFKLKGRILEVGCGTGDFISTFGEGWERYGCDISSFALKKAGEKGIKTYYGEFDKIDFEALKFNVICFRASLHHTYSPISSLQRAYELLDEGGVVVISMSNNCSGLMGKLFRGHIKSYDQTCNFLFSKDILYKYLNKNHFRVLGHYFPYRGTGYESYLDIPHFVYKFLVYSFAVVTRTENSRYFRDLSSPAFYGNYINIFAKKGR